MTISCSNAKNQSTAYLDGRLRSREHAALAAHLAECGDCNSHFDELSAIRSGLRQMRPEPIPEGLKTRLQVIASRERALVMESRGARFEAVWNRWKFRLSNLMKPLALPATGGVLSAVMLFGTFVFMIGTTTRVASYEIPLCSDSEANLVPVDMRGKLVVLNMTLNSTGRLGDYALSEPPHNVTADLRSHLGSITIPDMPTVFALEQPISGDIQIRLMPLGFRQ